MTSFTQSRKLFFASGTSAPAHAVSGLFVKLANWQGRAVQRRRLKNLDDRMLNDIGISRGLAEREARKPAWRQ